MRFLLPALCALSLLALPPAAQAAQGSQVDTGVVYTSPGGTPVTLDAYRATTGTGLRPAVILIHGGGWVFGDKAFYGPFCKRLASDGFAAFTINYRLAPKYHYPAAVDDARDAVRWVRTHAAEYSVDPQRVAALGDSAGGYLAAMLGVTDLTSGSGTISGISSHVPYVVDLYGPADFTLPPGAATTSTTSAGLGFLKSFFGKTPTEDPALYREGSPAVHVSAASAAFLILHGTADTLVPEDQSVRLFKALKAAGGSPEMALLYDFQHGFFAPAMPGEAGAMIESFLIRSLKP